MKRGWNGIYFLLGAVLLALSLAYIAGQLKSWLALR